MEQILPWLSGLVGLASLLYTIVSNRGKAAEARVTMLETRLALQERLMTEVKGELEHVPGKDSAHRLEMSVERLEGRFMVLDERLKPMASTVERLQEFLLDQARAR